MEALKHPSAGDSWGYLNVDGILLRLNYLSLKTIQTRITSTTHLAHTTPNTEHPLSSIIYIMLFISTLATLALALPATAAPQPITKRDPSDLPLNAQLRLAETWACLFPHEHIIAESDKSLVPRNATSSSPTTPTSSTTLTKTPLSPRTRTGLP
jgi:hypothetical protein